MLKIWQICFKFDLTANFKSMLWSGLWDDIFSRNPREPNAELYLRLSRGE